MTDLELALNKHRYVAEPGGRGQVNITTISKLLDINGKSSAFAGAAVKITKAGGDHRAEWKKSGELGTRVHGYMENFLLGKPINFRSGEEGFVTALERFIGAEDPQLILDPEFIVVSSEYGYGGRGDLCATLKNYGRGVWDLKSGKRYNIEHTLQLALLRFGQLAVYDDKGMLIGSKEMPVVETAGCVYVEASGEYEVVTYPADRDAFHQAVALLGVYNWTERPDIKAEANAWKKR